MAAIAGQHMLQRLQINDWRAHGLAAGVAGSGVAAAQVAARDEVGAAFAFPGASIDKEFAAAVPDVEHSNNVSLNREQDSIDVRFAAVQELPHFEVKLAILLGERATGGELSSRRHRDRLDPQSQRGRSCFRRKSSRN